MSLRQCTLRVNVRQRGQRCSGMLKAIGANELSAADSPHAKRPDFPSGLFFERFASGSVALATSSPGRARVARTGFRRRLRRLRSRSLDSGCPLDRCSLLGGTGRIRVTRDRLGSIHRNRDRFGGDNNHGLGENRTRHHRTRNGNDRPWFLHRSGILFHQKLCVTSGEQQECE